MSFSKIVQTATNDIFNSVDESINKFQKYPSIMSINENVSADDRFSFFGNKCRGDSSTNRSLKNNKAGTFMNIPTKQLKETTKIICEPLMDVWNEIICEPLKDVWNEEFI